MRLVSSAGFPNLHLLGGCGPDLFQQILVRIFLSPENKKSVFSLLATPGPFLQSFLRAANNVNLEGRNMKVYIKDRRKLVFLTADGGWSKQRKHAQNFRTIFSASDYCKTARHSSVDLVLELDNSRRLHTLPIEQAKNKSAKADLAS